LYPVIKRKHNYVKCNSTKYLAYLENSGGCFDSEKKSPTEFRKNRRVAGEG